MTPDTQHLTFPDPTLAVFLLCVHLFKDYTIVPPANGTIAIKLVELEEIGELTAHPQFDRQRFLDLVSRWEGRDAVGFVGHLLQTCLGSNPLPISPDKRRLAKRDQYPSLLTWCICWAAYSSVEDLLVPSDRCHVVDCVGTNTVVATTGEPRQIYTVFAPERGQDIPRVLVHSTHGECLPVEFGITWGAKALTFTFSLLSPLKGESQEYHIALRGGQYFHADQPTDIDYTANVSPRGIEYWHDALENVRVSFSEAGCALQMWLPWKALPRNLEQNPSIPLLLTIALRDSKAPFRLSFDPVMVIPLRVTRK